ncbi:hypothetical protein GS982_01190 [Rhodococcus hoagii]|uniref:Uncharacterized protein n=1 Tax=Rhodococcus hoagii TaxID=43767 RepID=A0A9Q5EYG5_RHOHA|nr:hypothetical protein [Prescottella equi]NKT77222.1 hypothetical protein [Prescottella equi]NKZ81006.1 hypothetical protein [Prescottella equi]
MILCPECGNKRCPRATWHEQTCTGSNEPGQAGSSYGPRDLAPKSLQEYWDQLYADLGND